MLFFAVDTDRRILARISSQDTHIRGSLTSNRGVVKWLTPDILRVTARKLAHPDGVYQHAIYSARWVYQKRGHERKKVVSQSFLLMFNLRHTSTPCKISCSEQLSRTRQTTTPFEALSVGRIDAYSKLFILLNPRIFCDYTFNRI